jgi:hypothetical protein
VHKHFDGQIFCLLPRHSVTLAYLGGTIELPQRL